MRSWSWLVLMALLGCSRPHAAKTATSAYWAEPWPEADALLRSDPRWLGGDGAVTIELSKGRVLWLFGDSFVAQGPPAGRGRARMVRNSVAIQEGANPACATVRFAMPTSPDGGPASFFAERGGQWFWPAHGALVDGALTVFLHRVVADPAEGGLGFRIAGWTAVRVEDVSGPPEQWRLTWLTTPDTRDYGLVGAAVVVRGEHVYAYAVREPTDHALALLRWKRAAFARGALGEPEYFRAGRGFGPWPPSVLLTEGASELSVTRAPRGRGYLQVQSRGFGAAPIGLRSAPELQGPFGPWRELYRPPESRRSELLLYAGRAHPELLGAELVVTYVSNSLDPSVLMSDASIYFPRFVRAGTGPRTAPPTCAPKRSQK